MLDHCAQLYPHMGISRNDAAGRQAAFFERNRRSFLAARFDQSATVANLTSNNPFTVSGGTLTVAGDLRVINTFNLTAGTIATATIQPGTGGQGLNATAIRTAISILAAKGSTSMTT